MEPSRGAVSLAAPTTAPMAPTVAAGVVLGVAFSSGSDGSCCVGPAVAAGVALGGRSNGGSGCGRSACGGLRCKFRWRPDDGSGGGSGGSSAADPAAAPAGLSAAIAVFAIHFGVSDFNVGGGRGGEISLQRQHSMRPAGQFEEMI